MSGIRNSALKFNFRGTQSVYSTPYEDSNRNVWLIELVGDAHAIRKLVERRAIALEARPLDPREFEARLDMARDAPPSTSPSRKIMAAAPEVSGYIHLLQLVVPKPYQVIFEIDPQIAKPPPDQPEYIASNHLWSFQLGEADSYANVTANATVGDVSICLSGEGNQACTQRSGETAGIATRAGSTTIWKVTVYWTNGDPVAEYTLSGDINLG